MSPNHKFYTSFKLHRLMRRCIVRLERLPLRRRSTRQPKRKEEKRLETIVSCLAVTDDSKHGIEVFHIENKGRGIKVG